MVQLKWWSVMLCTLKFFIIPKWVFIWEWRSNNVEKYNKPLWNLLSTCRSSSINLQSARNSFLASLFSELISGLCLFISSQCEKMRKWEKVQIEKLDPKSKHSKLINFLWFNLKVKSPQRGSQSKLFGSDRLPFNSIYIPIWFFHHLWKSSTT